MTPIDPRIACLAKIKKARQLGAKLRLARAIDIADEKDKAELRARERLVTLEVGAENYYHDKLAESTNIRNAGSFLTSITLGSFAAHREVERGKFTMKKSQVESIKAKEDRQNAAKDCLARMRGSEAFRKFGAERMLLAATTVDICEEDNMAEYFRYGQTND